VANRVDRLLVVARGDQEPSVGVVEDIAPLGRRQSIIERDGHHARLSGGEVEQDILNTILGQDADPVADL
jgi:hypothetical protein